VRWSSTISRVSLSRLTSIERTNQSQLLL
jgi:hypothetical protein